MTASYEFSLNGGVPNTRTDFMKKKRKARNQHFDDNDNAL